VCLYNIYISVWGLVYDLLLPEILYEIALQRFKHKCSNKMFFNSNFIAISPEYINISGKYSIV